MALDHALRRIRTPTAFALGIGGLALIDAFALLRPLASGGAPYGPRPSATGYSYSWFLLATFPAYALTLIAVRRADGPALRVVVACAAALSIPLAMAPLLQSQDLYSYLFYGRMLVVHRANPYVVEPAAFGRDPWLADVAWRHQVSVYGPLWSSAMAVVVEIAGSSLLRALLLAKAFALGLGGLTVWALVRIASRAADRRAAPLAVASLALNPMVLTAVALSGHADVAVAAALAWAMVADRRGRTRLSLVFLAAATLVKLYAGLALVTYLAMVIRRAEARRIVAATLLAAGAVTVGYVPYWRGIATLRGVGQVAERASSSLAGAVEAALAWLLSHLAVPDPAAAASDTVRAVGAVLVIAVAVRQVRQRTLEDRWAGILSVMVAYVLVTPWFLPWHALGALTVACALGDSALREALLVFSASCFPSTGPPLGVLGTVSLRYGPPVFAFERGRRQRGRSVDAVHAGPGPSARRVIRSRNARSRPRRAAARPARTARPRSRGTSRTR